jgi:hypothetical protein
VTFDAMFSVRKIAWKDTSMVNVCDRELVGKTLIEGKIKMHLSEEFFSGDLLDGGEVLRLLHGSPIISLAGKRAVGLAVENKLGAKEAVRLVEGVPFLMIYKFFY